MTDPAKPQRPARTDTPEVAALRRIRERHPELADAVDLQIELVELYRRVQSRVALPLVELSARALSNHQLGQPLLRFDDIRIEPTDLRLLVRQMADVLHRHGALDEADHRRIQTVGREMSLLDQARRWYEAPAHRHLAAAVGATIPVSAALPSADEALDQVLALALRPWLSRCADVLQQRPELVEWTHPACPMCAGEPDLAVITVAAERHLICSRCSLRWKFEPLTCPYCGNGDRSRITSFATSDGEYRVYACDACLRYLKAFDGRRATRPVMPLVDAIATLPLDAAAMQRGYR